MKGRRQQMRLADAGRPIEIDAAVVERGCLLAPGQTRSARLRRLDQLLNPGDRFLLLRKGWVEHEVVKRGAIEAFGKAKLRPARRPHSLVQTLNRYRNHLRSSCRYQIRVYKTVHNPQSIRPSV